MDLQVDPNRRKPERRYFSPPLCGGKQCLGTMADSMRLFRLGGVSGFWNDLDTCWLEVQELNLSYHNSETLSFGVYLFNGNFKQVP